MKYAIPAAALILLLLCLWALSAWRRPTVLRKDAGEAPESFHTQRHAEMRSDARYAEYMGEMVRCEKLSRESRLCYNGSVYQYNIRLALVDQLDRFGHRHSYHWD